MTTNVAYQNLRNAAKAVSTQNFMAVELQSKQGRSPSQQPNFRL